MGKKFFVTGTDTGVGKTLVSTALLRAAAERGLRTLGLKPVAAGCISTPEGLRNEDALALISASTEKIPYQQVNPVALEHALAPHIAAAKVERHLSLSQLVGYCRGALMTPNDFCVIEGAGGWRVPLNHRDKLSDLAKELNLPVILVVGIRLGCLNHALLTAEAILRDGLTISGWVANSIDPAMPAIQENIDSLKALLPFPMVENVPYITNLKDSNPLKGLDISKLLGP